MDLGKSAPDQGARDRVLRTYMDLKGRHVAVVEREGGGQTLGFSWSTYEAAVAEGSAYLDSLAERDVPRA